MNRLHFIGVLLIASLTLLSCSAEPTDLVLVNDARWLSDGQAVSWRMEPGRYKVELTATGDGASIEWAGVSCPPAEEAKQYSTICDFHQQGQVVVTNPTTFGLGQATSVSIKITHLAR